MRRVTGARRLVEAARGGGRRRTRRAARAVAQLRNAIRQGAEAGKIDPGVAARLLARVNRAVAEL